VRGGIAEDACDLIEGHWRVTARVVDRLTSFSLGELQLFQLGLAVIGEQERVDHRLVEAWGELLTEVGRAGAAKAAVDG
jgi:hypothetical protein